DLDRLSEHHLSRLRQRRARPFNEQRKTTLLSSTGDGWLGIAPQTQAHPAVVDCGRTVRVGHCRRIALSPLYCATPDVISIGSGSSSRCETLSVRARCAADNA